MAYGDLMFPWRWRWMTLEGQTCDPIRLDRNISKTADMLFSNNRNRLLRGSTVGYPSDNLASCFVVVSSDISVTCQHAQYCYDNYSFSSSSMGRPKFFHCLVTARCILVQSAVLRSHVVCPSVSLSVCDVGRLWSHRFEFFRNNFTIS